MNLDKIKTDTTWNDAAGSINSNFAKLVQALAARRGGSLDEEKVVIFDATCSADPWSLNELQTPTTVAEIKAAIEGNKPIYAKFANGFTPIGYAGIVAQKYVNMDIYLMDVEGGFIRTVNIYSGEGDQWSWDGFSHNLNGGGGGGEGGPVDTEMSDISTNAVQNKVIKKYVDAIANDVEAGLTKEVAKKQDILESGITIKTINGQSILGEGNIVIEGGGGGGTQYNLRFAANSAQTLYVPRGEKAEIKFTFISQVRYVGETEFTDTGEAGIVTISVKKATDNSYEKVKTMLVPSNTVQTVDVTEYLGDSNNLIRISGEGETTGKTAENLAFTVVRSSLSIQSNFQWWVPQTAGSITIPYYVGGSIDKVLHVTVTGKNYSKSYSKALGNQPYLESVATIIIEHPITAGVYTISAHASSADGNFSTHNYEMQAIFIKEGDAGQFMAVNNIAVMATNYGENAFFDYAVYDSGRSTASATFYIKKDGASIYEAALDSLATATKHTLSAPLEVTTNDSNNFYIAVGAVGKDGVVLLPDLMFEVDNSYSFAAFPDAAFYMNPKTRDNSQSNRLSIINEVDGKEYPATWDGMNWGSDGYQTVDGVKVLRIFAGSSVDIPYAPFEKEAARVGKTLELDFLVNNVVDYDDTVLGIVKDLTASWLGVKIFPDKAMVFSSLQGIENDQSLKFEDKTRLRLTIVVMPDAYGNAGFNLVMVYVNGTKNREFAYSNTDSFQNNSGIHIGSESADIDTYALRIYNEALSSSAVHQNYTNLLNSIEEKKAFHEKNDVYASNGVDIDIEKVKKRCNVIEFEGEIPSKSNPNKFTNNWHISWRDNPSWNILIEKIKQDGQGTSAKENEDWNQRGKTSDETVTTYADGSTTTGGFIFIPGLPKIKTFTWKLNWASSCQCNKMGSVNSINDLCRVLDLLDEDDNPVAIYQRPFVGFQLTYDESGQPVHTFLGLYTGGPDKSDKGWMNYDYNRYPNLISVEGADNASLGALFKVPWNPAAGRWRYNSDEESMQYNGVNAFDYNAGKAETDADIQALFERVWMPIYNFVHECSPNLTPWPGTISELNAQASNLKDTDSEYWLPSGDLYYYEAAEGKYIPVDYGKGTMNLFDQLVDKGYGLTSEMVSGLSGNALNEAFRQARVSKFAKESSDYFNIPQSRFSVNWMETNGSTDTRTKNTYWIIRGLLSDGYKCTFFWDDTDTIGPFTNQGQDRKPYWCEVGDKYDNGQPVWNGEQNRFYNLMELAFPEKLANDMRKKLDAMVQLGGMTTGNKSEQLFAFYHKYYFSQAQEYFPSALYNAAAKTLYESAKLVYGISYNNDTDPITQSLGDYYSGWKRWIKRRIQYIQSKYHWGDYSASSGDSIIVRAAGQSINYQITPAIWMYPVVMNGTSPIRGERTEAGKVCHMTIDLGGSADQQNAIKGVHYLQDIGAWHDKNVHGAMSVTGSMLRELHIGHPTEDIVITISSLTVKNTPSLKLIDLRRVGSLTGALNLADCTHLQTFYGQGTALTSVSFGQGGPLAYVGYPATMQQIFLSNFPRLENGGIDISTCKEGITDLLVNECPNVKSLDLMMDIMDAQKDQADHALVGVRVTGIDEQYDSSEVITSLATLTDGSYQGLNADGSRNEGHAILEGKVLVNANAYRDDVDALEAYFAGRLAITINGSLYIRFADSEVLRVLLANGVGDGVGITKEQAEAVTTISDWFKANPVIETFNELGRFTNVKRLIELTFDGSTNLRQIDLSNIEHIGTNCFWGTALEGELNTPKLVRVNANAFYSCAALTKIDLSKVTTIGWGAFRYCSSLEDIGSLENIEGELQQQIFRDCTSLTGDINLPKVTQFHTSGYAFPNTRITSLNAPLTTSLAPSTCSQCKSLKSVNIPLVTSIGSQCFSGCTSLVSFDFSNIEVVGYLSFADCTSLKKAILPKVTSMSSGAFARCTALQAVVIDNVTPPTMDNTSAFVGTTCLFYVPDSAVETYKSAANWSNYASRIFPLSEYEG